MARLILASSSPRRKQLLEMLNIPFEIITADIDEKIDYDNDLQKEIEKLSFQKADAIFENNKDAIVIGSDTIVKIGNKALGKPKTKQEAKQMLQSLSDNTHQVITAVTILTKDSKETFSSITDVNFYKLDEEEIDKYIETQEPFDKAGAYAIQGKGLEFVKGISGDFYTVMGLPVAELYRRLKKYL